MRWKPSILLALALACGGSDSDSGSGSGDADTGTSTTSGDTGTGTGTGGGECPGDIAPGMVCDATQCCDGGDHLWQCQCVAQCDENCCTWEPFSRGYCIFTNGGYQCGAGSDLGEACPMDLVEGAACDTGVLEGCCAEDGSIFRCRCAEACWWEREDCTVANECVQMGG